MELPIAYAKRRKKIRVVNSPWGRSYERPSDCLRWVRQGHAMITDKGLLFTQPFYHARKRDMIEMDPTGEDDGIPRRYVNARSHLDEPPVFALNGKLIEDRLIVVSWTGIASKQLLPVAIVGTGNQVTKRHDNLIRRQGRPAKK